MNFKISVVFVMGLWLEIFSKRFKQFFSKLCSHYEKKFNAISSTKKMMAGKSTPNFIHKIPPVVPIQSPLWFPFSIILNN